MPKVKTEVTYAGSLEKVNKARNECLQKIVEFMKLKPDLDVIDEMIDELSKVFARAKSLKEAHVAAWNADGTPVVKALAELKVE